VSDLEVLADDAANLAKAAAGDGVAVQHEVFTNVQHVWQLDYPQRPEAVTAFDQIAAFVAEHAGASGPQ
jgi:acetyl esterase/lipase